eukprot:TRINITY_DN5042_c0_g6_i1.p1 TRINITY_DN5042_c0_g6~~TRINITY_DN5042_c0_g6_i1.p1  ORF type:complete len:375 (+),score=72.30 TRINITY_DN5042_c0_g6_i1:49-1125(+)
MDPLDAEGFASVAVGSVTLCALLLPFACRLLWSMFGECYEGCLAPKSCELSSSQGQVAVGVSLFGAACEWIVCSGWCGLPYLFSNSRGLLTVSDPVEFLMRAPESLVRLYEMAMTGEGLITMACLSIYTWVTVLWVVSYLRAMDTKSDALFTIDMQRGERVCDTCSRLCHHHTHHCTYCWRCVDRFDHHSFYINNCVAERNVKFYTLSLVYHVVRCIMSLALILPYLFFPTGPGLFVALVALLFWTVYNIAAVGFLLGVWATAVTYGFNTSTDTGKYVPGGTSSLVILDSVLTLVAAREMRPAQWTAALQLPNLPRRQKDANWAAVMGKGSRLRWWWPSSPYKFPDYGHSAFIFKRGW